MKPTTLAIIGLTVIALLVGIIAARADNAGTTLVWDPNDPADKVTSYIVQFRPRTTATNPAVWSEVIVPSIPSPTAVLPVSPFGTEFRLAAANSFGRSPWTDTVFLPAAARGLKLVLPLSP